MWTARAQQRWQPNAKEGHRAPDAVQTHTIIVVDGMSDCWHAVDIVSGTRIARIRCEARVLEREASTGAGLES